MIQSLKYVATFNSTGRTLKNQLNFKPGLTVITGENEAGKSFVLEMIRYALFGSDALRSVKTDYSKLEVTLKIEVKGKLYTIVREGNKATINKTESVGTTSVNNYIVKLLGFGLLVFDISANVKQHELDKLTKDMRPTERRKIIDDVTGLSQFEKAEKECREESNSFLKLVDALKAQMVEPIEPAVPDDYEPSEDIKTRLDIEIRNQALRDNFEEMSKPSKPQIPEASEDDIEHEADRKQWFRQATQLQDQIDDLPEVDTTYSASELKDFLKYFEQEQRGPLPTGHSVEELSAWSRDIAIRRREEEPIKCGECGAIVTGRELPPQPPLTQKEIQEETTRQSNWKGFRYDDSLVEPPISQEQTAIYLEGYKSQPERTLLEKQLEDMGPEPEDRSQQATEWAKYVEDKDQYERDSKAYVQYLTKKAAIDDLPEPEKYLQEKYEMALRYETLTSRYEATLEVYETQQTQLEKAQDKREGFKRGSNALKDARKDVKRYLVPSLSKVASHLLTEMTDGERREIKIDEDFEIWVDNQHVRTLSGSGTSIVNLAIRIALGQVLTQSIIPIFMADEIDGDMADRRTKATHDSLRRLKDKLKQIIIVTHKDFQGDHEICLT